MSYFVDFRILRTFVLLVNFYPGQNHTVYVINRKLVDIVKHVLDMQRIESLLGIVFGVNPGDFKRSKQKAGFSFLFVFVFNLSIHSLNTQYIKKHFHFVNLKNHLDFEETLLHKVQIGKNSVSTNST